MAYYLIFSLYLSSHGVLILKFLCYFGNWFITDTTSETVNATLYRQMIGSLMYLTNTRPDICFVVNTLSQYMVEPRHVHLIATKHVLRYLKGTLDYGLRYVADCEF